MWANSPVRAGDLPNGRGELGHGDLLTMDRTGLDVTAPTVRAGTSGPHPTERRYVTNDADGLFRPDGLLSPFHRRVPRLLSFSSASMRSRR
jgi:hypothetical protein